MILDWHGLSAVCACGERLTAAHVMDREPTEHTHLGQTFVAKLDGDHYSVPCGNAARMTRHLWELAADRREALEVVAGGLDGGLVMAHTHVLQTAYSAHLDYLCSKPIALAIERLRLADVGTQISIASGMHVARDIALTIPEVKALKAVVEEADELDARDELIYQIRSIASGRIDKNFQSPLDELLYCVLLAGLYAKNPEAWFIYFCGPIQYAPNLFWAKHLADDMLVW